jgi:predicted nucleic acid-binding protein
VIYLADTNVLLRFAIRTHPLHALVRNAVRKLRAGGHRLCSTPQNCAEFWNVATRPPANNGFGCTPVTAARYLRSIERAFPVLLDAASTYAEWRRLVVSFGVSGIQVHDARLTAIMVVYGLTHILTFNTADFARYAPLGIVAVDPTTV